MSANAKNSAYKARPVGGEIYSPDIIMLKAIDWANDVYINWQWAIVFAGFSSKIYASNKNSFAAELAKDHLNPAFNKSYKFFYSKLISLTVRVKQRRAVI